MPVETTHRQLGAVADAVQTVRDCIAGARAVKAAGARYLPRLSWKKNANERYEAYKQRAVFENVVRRTRDGLVGLVFCEDPEVAVPEAFKPRLEDITLTGVPFAALAQQVFSEVVSAGRCGVLADMAPEQDGVSGLSQAYLALYTNENIVNWATERREGRQVLTRVVLRECIDEPDPQDRFGAISVTQYRVVELVDGVLQHQLWRQTAAKGDADAVFVEYGSPVVPLRRGTPLDFVPFTFFGPTSVTPDVEAPPLADLADLNISAYQSSADLEHGRHFTGLPTPYVFGADTKSDLEIGSGTAWTSANADAKAGYLEFTGQGLGALERAIQEKREMMVAQGARLIERQKRAAETAEALRLRQSGESSVLAAMAGVAGLGLSIALAQCAWWQGGTVSLEDARKSVTVKLNTEFEEEVLTAQDAKALAETWQLGGMSKRTYVWNIQAGKRLPPDTTIEQELEMIEMEAAQRGMGGVDDDDPPGTDDDGIPGSGGQA